MTKRRVHELARDLELDWKILRDKGKPLGIDIATHQATISPEEEKKLRAAVAGGTPPAAAPGTAAGAAPAASAGGGGRVVIRRRRADSEEAPAEAESAAPVVATAPPVAPPVVAAPVAPVAKAPEPVVVAKAPEPTPVVPQPVAVVAKPTPEVEKPAVTAAPAAVQQPVPPPQPVVVAPAATVPTKPVMPPPAVVATAPTPPPPASIPVAAPVSAGATVASGPSAASEEATARRKAAALAGGATIVRRASAEEIEAQKAREASLQANRTARKEDNRGVRVSGMGLLSRNRPNAGGAPGGFRDANAPAGPGGVTSPDMIPDPAATEEWQTRKVKTREEEASEEGQKSLGKTVKQKRANSGISMRALLEQLDDGTDAEEAPVVDEQQSRVFTPNAAHRRRDMRRRKDLKKTQITTPRAQYRVVEMDGSITVGELSRQLSIKAGDVIKKLMGMGGMATMNQDLDVDTATLIASEYGFEIKNEEITAEDVISQSSNTQTATAASHRPPIVTIMGHVDHGKTSLLDAIRSANVASGEAGGITQHIGAYTVDYNNKRIAFLDTPGHEAFSSMRARGASLTDIVILVVAADDGVMPQTVEAINHAKAANVPIIVAVNKIDKHGINLDRLFAQLAEHGIQSEEWGGENQFVKTSALQRIGIDEILEAILLQAEVLDLSAPAEGFATGAVVEAHLDKGRGPIATIMVQTGTLEIGQYVVAGMEYGRVRAMTDHRGQKVTKAGPSTPVEVVGLGGVPSAGDRVNAVEDEKTCREVVSLRQETERKKHVGKSSAASLADLLAKVQNSERPEVPIIVKADVQGSLEAVCEAIAKLPSPKVSNRIVHRAVGGITESDVQLATATGAVIVGFNVRAARGLDDQADREGVVLRYFSIIYELVDAVKAIMAGKLPPIVTEQVLGHAEVRQTISVPKIGTIAGSSVLDGKITRQSHLRLVRDSVVIYNGRISSLRRFKDDVREVAQGYECGIGIDGYQDIRVGDVIEAYVLEETAPVF